METTWNPVEEHIEGKLCEKGLMQEHYDFEKDDLVRKLTPEGRLKSELLLQDPFWLKQYLKLAKKQFSKYPEETKKILWKNLANQIRDLKGRK